MSANESLIARIEAILPQTQCRQCRFDGCRPYAVALARGEADADRCPPGGDTGARALADLLGRPYRPVDATYGPPKRTATRVVIDETVCIGCTKCIQACPVDAIVGANQLMHTVVASECTGCELCIPTCPVDCIAVVPVAASDAHYQAHVDAQRPHAYRRHHARAARLQRLQDDQVESRARRRAQLQAENAALTPAAAPIASTAPPADDPVARAIAAARARRAQRSSGS
jgi:electron transport complex protein RnfB